MDSALRRPFSVFAVFAASLLVVACGEGRRDHRRAGRWSRPVATQPRARPTAPQARPTALRRMRSRTSRSRGPQTRPAMPRAIFAVPAGYRRSVARTETCVGPEATAARTGAKRGTARPRGPACFPPARRAATVARAAAGAASRRSVEAWHAPSVCQADGTLCGEPLDCCSLACNGGKCGGATCKTAAQSSRNRQRMLLGAMRDGLLLVAPAVELLDERRSPSRGRRDGARLLLERVQRGDRALRSRARHLPGDLEPLHRGQRLLPRRLRSRRRRRPLLHRAVPRRRPGLQLDW